MLSWFENLVDPYPTEPPKAPPKGFAAFLWAGTQGMRRYLLGMTLLTACIGAFEALLFSMLGSIVDWLSTVAPSQLWTTSRQKLWLLAGVLLLSPLAVWVQTMLKHQALAVEVPAQPHGEVARQGLVLEHGLHPHGQRAEQQHGGQQQQLLA